MREKEKNVFICWQFDRYGTYRLCNAHICQQSHRSEPAVTYKAADFGVLMLIEFNRKIIPLQMNICCAETKTIRNKRDTEIERKRETNWYFCYSISSIIWYYALLKTITLRHIWWHTSVYGMKPIKIPETNKRLLEGWRSGKTPAQTRTTSIYQWHFIRAYRHEVPCIIYVFQSDSHNHTQRTWKWFFVHFICSRIFAKPGKIVS